MVSTVLVLAMATAALAVDPQLPATALRGGATRTIQAKSNKNLISETRHLQSSEYIGCYADTANDRVLSHAVSSSTMTVDVCRTICEGDGYVYYALQYSKECYCGTSDISGDYDRHGTATCNKPCAGDQDTVCGGTWAFDLYAISAGTGSTLSPSPSSSSAAPASTLGPSPSPSTSSATSSEFTELLDLHNAVRCMHDADALTYSTTLASEAQTWAANLVSSTNCGNIFHSSSNYGENIFLCGTTASGHDCYNAPYAMQGWYDDEVTDAAVTTYEGHATQILWTTTTEVGCAVDSCSSGRWYFNVLVCNYNPPGNYLGQVATYVNEPSKSAAECGYE